MSKTKINLEWSLKQVQSHGVSCLYGIQNKTRMGETDIDKELSGKIAERDGLRYLINSFC